MPSPHNSQANPYECARRECLEQEALRTTTIQEETGLDRKSARLLYLYRHCDWMTYPGSHLSAADREYCEKLNDRLAERAVRNIDDNIDWDGLDARRRERTGAQPAQDWRTTGAIGAQAQPQQPSASGNLDVFDAGDDPGKIPPREWLLGNQFCRSFISSIVAAGGTGKSALRLLQFISLATGRPLSDQYVFRRCRVLLISLEDDGNELQRRIKAVLDYYKIDRAELKGRLFCSAPKLAKLAEMQNRTRAIGPLEQQIRDAIAQYKPDIISLDPFIKTHSLEENKNVDMDFVCDLLARIAVEFNVAVDSPHHVHKGQIEPGDADAGRGASGIKDAGRLVYTLVPMSEADAKVFNIDADARLSYVRLDPAKTNIAARAGKATWFHMIGQNIGNATADYPNGDTVQVVEPWAIPDAWADTTTKGLNAILDDIARGMTDDAGKPNGRRYTNAPAAKDRQVWPVVQKHYPNKPEGLCRTIIYAWLETKLLYPDDYDDPVDYKPRKGLYVNDAKRPGTTTSDE
jgi:AAA domain